jgi:predicted MFS family arabinose efflux permease
MSLILDGLILGYITANNSKMLPVNIRTDLNVGFLLIILGIGAVVGGLISGYLSDRIRITIEGKICFLIVVFTILLSAIINQLNPETVVLPFVSSFFWGVTLHFL